MSLSWPDDGLAVRVFFIISAFPFCRSTSTDDSNAAHAFRKADQQESTVRRMTDDDLALFLFRVDFVIENRSQGIGKNCGCFLKAYPVLFQIGSGFVLVPLKFQAHLAF